MPDSAHVPEAPETVEWDAVVVGTGMGGSTVGYALARRGLRVLFVEKGRYLFGDTDRGLGRVGMDEDQSPQARLARGWWPLPIQGRTSFGALEFFAPLGCGTGGTTGLFAAQLERLSPIDFEPKKNHPGVTGTTLPDAWPIRYEELLPYYRQAETLYRVTGSRDPLAAEEVHVLREPPPLSPRDQLLYEAFQEVGLHPYRAHCGYEFVPGCGECGGALCPRACKSDAGRVSMLPAIEQHGAQLLTECEVLSLESDGTHVTGVRCRVRDRELLLRGKVVVLAAGALMSPMLLLRSANDRCPHGLANSSGLVGRNLMFHVSDFIAVRPGKNRPADGGPKKALALNDFYVHEGVKLGTFQSVGVAVEAGTVMYYLRNATEKLLPRAVFKLALPFMRVIARLAAMYFRRAQVFATILEDLPYAHNRVLRDDTAKNGMRFEYRYPDELRARVKLFRATLRRVLSKKLSMLVLTGEQNLNYGHVCGTCRFGDDPKTSVLDAENRAHDVDNLYVVDASFFPSSGGTNPSLTIAANALRVGERIAARLQGQRPAAHDAGTREATR